MKKKAILCTTLVLLLLTSCAKEIPVHGDTGTSASNGTPSVPNGPAWQAVLDLEYDSLIVKYVDELPFVETKHGIVFRDARDGNLLKYMEKETGDVRVLCDDPLCDHSASRESCPASGDGVECSSLFYRWEKALYIARIYDPSAPTAEQRSEILSINIDEMDLTPTRHLLTEPGERIICIGFSNNHLYYTYGTATEDGAPATKMESLLIDDVPETLHFTRDNIDMVFPVIFDSFVIERNNIYYSDTSYTLRWCNLLRKNEYDNGRTAIKYEGVAWTPGDGGRNAPSTYMFYQYYILYCGDDCLKVIDSTLSEKKREIWHNEGTTYTGWTLSCLMPPPPEEVQGELWPPKWLEITDDILYSLDDDPRIINTTDASGKSSTVTNVSGGKILRWVNGVPEPFADLGERTVIHSLTAIENAVFIEATVYDEAGREQPQYFYTFGGRVCTVPMQGLPQG